MIVSKIIFGVKYSAEYKGILYAQMVDEMCCRSSGKISRYKIAETMFSDIFTEPKELVVDGIDYFDNYENALEVFNAVFEFGFNVLHGNVGKTISKTVMKKEVRKNWAAWRLIYSDIGNFTHDYVFNKMTPAEIEKANIALDIVISKLKHK